MLRLLLVAFVIWSCVHSLLFWLRDFLYALIFLFLLFFLLFLGFFLFWLDFARLWFRLLLLRACLFLLFGDHCFLLLFLRFGTFAMIWVKWSLWRFLRWGFLRNHRGLFRWFRNFSIIHFNVFKSFGWLELIFDPYAGCHMVFFLLLLLLLGGLFLLFVLAFTLLHWVSWVLPWIFELLLIFHGFTLYFRCDVPVHIILFDAFIHLHVRLDTFGQTFLDEQIVLENLFRHMFDMLFPELLSNRGFPQLVLQELQDQFDHFLHVWFNFHLWISQCWTVIYNSNQYSLNLTQYCI